MKTGARGTGLYDLEHFQVHERAGGNWTDQRRTVTYRAYRRHALIELASSAGLQDVAWRISH